MNWFVLQAAFVSLFVCAGCKAKKSGVGLAPPAGFGSVPERVREPSRRWDALGCSERRLPNKYVEFERVSEEHLQSTEFICAMALYLDGPAGTQEQFRHLAEVANRSGKWGAALFEYMAELSWERFEGYLGSRLRSLRAEELIAICKSWDEWSKGRSPEMLRNLRSLCYEQAFSNASEEVRGYAIGFVAGHGVTLKEAEALAKRLPVESAEGPRQNILIAQIMHNAPATNRVVRDFLRGPAEPSILEWTSRYELASHGRYDFLPDLYELRRRLEGEKDITKVESARQVLRAVDDGIKRLEDLKRKGAPIAREVAPSEAAP